VEVSFEHSNKLSVSVICLEILERLSKLGRLGRDSFSCSE
jgi:hypothetical protein